MPGGKEARIRWDRSKMKSHHPKALNLSTSRGEITLSLGKDRISSGVKDEGTYQVPDRIIMSPYTAKRLMALLNDFNDLNDLNGFNDLL